MGKEDETRLPKWGSVTFSGANWLLNFGRFFLKLDRSMRGGRFVCQDLSETRRGEKVPTYVTTEPGVVSGVLMLFLFDFCCRENHIKHSEFCDLLRSRNSQGIVLLEGNMFF